jgi:2-polyprenyl-3-methyl-5-hydroxy-6-metoxy-1,4-benzoquinol methylase
MRNTRKNTDLKAYYNSVYKRGEREHYTYFRLQKGDLPEEFAAVYEMINWKGKTVMDAGCGTGDMCGLITEAGAQSVLGADYSEEAIAEAKEKYSAPNLTFRCGDVSDVKETFDIILSNGTLEHMDHPLEVLKQWKEKLNKGGSLILTCPNWLNPRGYMLQMLWHLFRAPITLADLHYLSPMDFEEWANVLGMELVWSTVDHEWGGGQKMVEDFKKRLPNVTRDAGWKVPQEQIDEFLSWLEKCVVPNVSNKKNGGAVGIYHLKLK